MTRVAHVLCEMRVLFQAAAAAVTAQPEPSKRFISPLATFNLSDFYNISVVYRYFNNCYHLYYIAYLLV